MSLTTPMLYSEVAGGVTPTIVCLFREPDAGNPPVRFDEREQEPEPSQTGLRRRRESLVSSHRETNATAPVLDSTRYYTILPRPFDSARWCQSIRGRRSEFLALAHHSKWVNLLDRLVNSLELWSYERDLRGYLQVNQHA